MEHISLRTVYLFFNMKYYSFVVPINKTSCVNIENELNDFQRWFQFYLQKYDIQVIDKLCDYSRNVVIETIFWTERMTYVKLNLMRSHGPQNDML